MMRRGRLLFIFVSLTVVAVMVGGSLLASTARRDDGSDSPYKYLSMFVEVLDLVRRAYVDETDASLLMEGALEGVTDALGPYSLYIPASAFERFEAARAVGAAHSGLTVLKERGVAYAAGVVPGSPAADAGFERGDLLSIIDGVSTRELPLWRIQEMLAAAPGTEIAMQRIRMGEQDELTITLGTYEPPGVRLTVESGVAVIDVDAIGPTTARDLALSLDALGDATSLPDLEVDGALVLDLRDVIGGDAERAYDIAALFATGELGALVSRDEVLETYTREGAPRFDGRLIVMINGGTQGAAEAVAAALHGNEQVQLVGQTSFGHCGRESTVSLTNGDRLQITTAYFTGQDREPIKEGLEPDVSVRTRGFDLDADQERDEILEKALEVARGETDPVEERKVA